MIDEILKKLRSAENLKNCIINSVELDGALNRVTVRLITDITYNQNDVDFASGVVKQCVPAPLDCTVKITKLTPDAQMIKRRIVDAVEQNFKALSVTLDETDITVEKCDGGYNYTIFVMPSLPTNGICEKITESLKKSFCGDVYGKCVRGKKLSQDI